MKRVVVTGRGIISPIGNTVEQFAHNVMQGHCGIDYITKFDTEGFKVRIAAEVKNFDATQYMEKSELRKTDLYTQYTIAAAAQAVAESKLEGQVDPERLGVYIGSGIGGMNTFTTEAQKMFEKGPGRVSPFFIPMMISNIAAGVVAIRYNAQGPSLPVVTACATSTNAIGEAFRAIRYGYADAILAGGAEAAINPLAMAGFTSCMALSTRNLPNESSIPFDKRRDGFVMGEGAGVLVLEEYEHAKARGAHIYGEVVGYCTTNDAYHITAPHPEAEGSARALRLALQEAGWQPGMGLYINAHGTSTPLNDKTETLSIKKALGEAEARRAHISSTKSMTGHMLGATGVAEALASLLALQQQTVPPTIGLHEPDEECDLNYTPNTKVEAKLDMAASISLGFGGHNAVVAFVPAAQ